MHTTAEELIGQLGLSPHPEGGWFRFCARSGVPLPPGAAGSAGQRDSCSHIYYLLRRNEISRWHRLTASEIWCWHGGGSLCMTLGGDGELPAAGKTLTIGPHIGQGEQFSVLVPAGQWQTARVTDGEFALVSCVVAPSYDDDDCLLPARPLPNEIYPQESEF